VKVKQLKSCSERNRT